MCGDTFEYGDPSLLPNTVGVRENSELVPNMAPLITCVGLQFSTRHPGLQGMQSQPGVPPGPGWHALLLLLQLQLPLALVRVRSEIACVMTHVVSCVNCHE